MKQLLLILGLFGLILVVFIAPPPGQAATGDITLVSWLYFDDLCDVSDIWGYRSGDNYYALVGEVCKSKLYIVDVTIPESPVLVTAVEDFPSTDIKIFQRDGKTYVYGVNDFNNISGLLELTDLQNLPPIQYNIFGEPPNWNMHNISISDRGDLYLSTRFRKLYAYDLLDPENPASAWNDDGDSHDSTAKGNRLYDFGSDGAEIFDISDMPTGATLLGTVPHGSNFSVYENPYGGRFSHSGDASPDNNYLYICDELAPWPEWPIPRWGAGDIYIWNIQNPAAPVFVDSITDVNSSAHNLYFVGDFAFSSYFVAGLKVFDVTNPAQPQLLDEYDTSPGTTGEGFQGAWGVYPYDDRGFVYISDRQNGLFVFAVEGFTSFSGSPAAPPPLTQINGTVHFPNTYGPPDYNETKVYFQGVGCECTWQDRTLIDGSYHLGVPQGWNGRVFAGGYGKFRYSATGEPDVDFTNVTGVISGIDFTAYDIYEEATPSEFNAAGPTQGVTWIDYDDDGDLDVLFIRDWAGSLYSELWENDGGSYSLVFTPAGRHSTAAWADHDNDGDLDLYLGSIFGPNQLFNQGSGGSFTEVVSTPINDAGYTNAVSWIDYDEDGRVDMYIGNGNGANKLIRNTGLNQFVDVTASSGLGDTSYTTSMAWADYDNDGDNDVFVANLHSPGTLYRNQGNGTFVAATNTGIDHSQNSASSARWGDYDNDADPDLLLAFWAGIDKDLIYKNNGNGTFTCIEIDASTEDVGSNGADWMDRDNDGDLDCMITKQNQNFFHRNLLFENQGGDQFESIWRIALIYLNEESRGFTWGDADGDGDLDVLISNVAFDGCPEPCVSADHLIINHSDTNNNWLIVKLVGDSANKRGIGAKVTIQAGGVVQSRMIDGGGGYRSQGPLVAHFGLGNATQVSWLRVDWPTASGTTYSVVYNIGVNQVYTYTQPAPPPPCPKCPIPQTIPGMTELPEKTALIGNVPNPFNPSTAIQFSLAERVNPTISIYDVSGRRVQHVEMDSINPGHYSWTWDGRDMNGQAVATGVYFVVFRAGSYVESQKAVLVK